VVSCLSEGYGRLFRYEGSRTDKHVREHEIYTVQATTASLQRTAITKPRRQQLAGSGAVVMDKLSQTAVIVTDNLRRKPRLGTAIAMVAILTVAVGLRLGRQPAAAPVATPPSPPPRAAVAPAPVKEAVPETKPAAPGKPAAAPAKPATAASKTAAASTRFGAAPAKSRPAPAAAPMGEEIEEAPVAVAEIAAPATVSFAISPWGEVHVNGKMRGIAPPLRNVELPPGRHRIEIRNANSPPHVEIVDARSGSTITIRHKFQN
jgi:hypothetical protein